MGPTNVALLNLFRADKALREAVERLESVTKDVRAQEARNNATSTKLQTATARHKDLQVKSANFELDLKMREEHIEKLRGRQQQASNNKEYQALLVEINTAKVDRAKVEEQAIRTMEQAEIAGNEVRTLTASLQAEEAKLADMRAKVGDKAAAAQAEVDRLRPERQAAAAGIKPQIVEQFDKLADRYEGEAMAAIEQPNPRDEEYLCTGCNMGLVPDVFNKLKTRDDVVACPTCRRILYIPEAMVSEVVETKKTRGGGKSGGTKTTKKVTKIAAPAEPESKWAAIVSAAQGESARDAAEADHKPVEVRVEINGELVGTFKGKSVEHFERVLRFRLEESKMSAEVKVTPVAPAADQPASEQPAPEQPAEQTAGT